jgi:hypothetical protein
LRKYEMVSGRFPLLLLIISAGSTLSYAQTPVLSSSAVCHFYGEASSGGSAFNKDEACTIPNIELLDTSYQQGDFICCGGGASAPTTTRDIPPGLEAKIGGGYYWAAYNPKLSGRTFTMHTYCGPASSGGPGCNVKVDVIAHYRIMPAATPATEPATTTKKNEQPDTKPTPQEPEKTNSKTDSSTLAGVGIDKVLAFAFGVVFVIVLLCISIFDRNPTPLAIFIYRVVLALAAAGIGAVIPGMIDVNVAPVIRAGGALALFVIVYWFRPADLIAKNQPPGPTPER